LECWHWKVLVGKVEQKDPKSNLPEIQIMATMFGG